MASVVREVVALESYILAQSRGPAADPPGVQMEELRHLTFELSNTDRLRILDTLTRGEMNVTNLSKALDLTLQECSRHLSRLEGVGLTEKDTEGLHHVSRYGELVLKQLPGLEFVAQHREYFLTHSLSHLPSEFVCRLGELRGASSMDDVMVGFYQVDKMLKLAEEYVWTITDQYLMSQVPYFKEALERGVEIRNIDVEYAVPARGPGELMDIELAKAFNQARSGGLLIERFIDRLDVYMYISEKGVAGLAFPLPTGRFDYLGFASTDDRARKWCEDLFEYYWERSTPRLEVIEKHQKWFIRNREALEALKNMIEGKDAHPRDSVLNALEEAGMIREGRVTGIGQLMYVRLCGPHRGRSSSQREEVS